MAKPKDPNMVEMSVLVPKHTRDALQQIWATRGLTISQQVRHSLALWIQACERDPDKLEARVAAREAKEARQAYQIAHGKAPAAPETTIDLDNDPEPDPATDPAGWASWSARQGNRAIAQLAKGHWPKGPTEPQ